MRGAAHDHNHRRKSISQDAHHGASARRPTTAALLSQVAGYLGNCENKLFNDHTCWRAPLTEDETSSADSLKLTLRKYIVDRTGATSGDYVCAKCAAISHVIA
jgi:hypothetical protein